MIGLEDLDELLSGLKPDEIKELSIIDPDVRRSFLLSVIMMSYEDGVEEGGPPVIRP